MADLLPTWADNQPCKTPDDTTLQFSSLCSMFSGSVTDVRHGAHNSLSQRIDQTLAVSFNNSLVAFGLILALDDDRTL